MFAFFDSVVNFFTMIWDFIVNTVNGLFTLLKVLASTAQLSAVLPGQLPAIIASCVLMVVSLGVIKLIVGR